MGLLQAAAFQLRQPEGLDLRARCGRHVPPAELPAARSAASSWPLTMMVVIVPTAVLWAVAGGALERLATRPDAQRAVSLGLAALLVATIVLVWI